MLPRGAWFGYAAALAITALMTAPIALVRAAADVPNASMLYLLAVLASAALFGSRPAIVSAAAAFLAFNFFFVHPEFTFTVADEDQWVALGLLLLTGIVTGQLAAGLRERARETERREREATVLYDVVRLMSEPDRCPRRPSAGSRDAGSRSYRRAGHRPARRREAIACAVLASG